MRLECSIGWGFNHECWAEALLQAALLILEEDSQAAAGGGKVVQQLMADHEWSWEEEETALYHEMARYQSQLGLKGWRCSNWHFTIMKNFKRICY